MCKTAGALYIVHHAHGVLQCDKHTERNVITKRRQATQDRRLRCQEETGVLLAAALKAEKQEYACVLNEFSMFTSPAPEKEQNSLLQNATENFQSSGLSPNAV